MLELARGLGGALFAGRNAVDAQADLPAGRERVVAGCPPLAGAATSTIPVTAAAACMTHRRWRRARRSAAASPSRGAASTGTSLLTSWPNSELSMAGRSPMHGYRNRGSCCRRAMIGGCVMLPQGQFAHQIAGRLIG